MKLIDGIKEKGNPYIILDSTRDELPGLFKDLGYKRGVEIGVERGINFEKYCKTGLNMYAIDPWIVNSIYSEAKIRLKSYDYVEIRKLSMDAVSDFSDRSLDFVYIDGNHKFRFIAEDLYEWSKKVKKGGIIAGHDYCRIDDNYKYTHVRAVVDAFTNAYHIDNWYIFGQKDIKMSYMFIKNW